MYTKTPKTHISQSNSEASQDDPIRMARDHWVVRHGKVSDSTEIIDSIDIDMIDVRNFVLGLAGPCNTLCRPQRM